MQQSPALLTIFGTVFAAVFAGVAPACLAYLLDKRKEREVARRERKKTKREIKRKNYASFLELFSKVVANDPNTNKEQFILDKIALAEASNALILTASGSFLNAYKKFQDKLKEDKIDPGELEKLASELFNVLRKELGHKSLEDTSVIKFYKTRL